MARKRSPWWVIGVLLILSAILLLNFDQKDTKEEQEEGFTPPKAPQKDAPLKVSPSKTEDPNSKDERTTLKPLS